MRWLSCPRMRLDISFPLALSLIVIALELIIIYTSGLSFFLLGALKLGALVGFFPRHILVGCIGGVGAFLIETGCVFFPPRITIPSRSTAFRLTVSLRIPDDDFRIDVETLKFMFLDPHNLALWSIPLALAVLLRVITNKWNHQLIFPVCEFLL